MVKNAFAAFVKLCTLTVISNYGLGMSYEWLARTRSVQCLQSFQACSAPFVTEIDLQPFAMEVTLLPWQSS